MDINIRICANIYALNHIVRYINYTNDSHQLVCQEYSITFYNRKDIILQLHIHEHAIILFILACK